MFYEKSTLEQIFNDSLSMVKKDIQMRNNPNSFYYKESPQERGPVGYDQFRKEDKMYFFE